MKKIISLSALALAALIPSQAEAAWGFTAHQGVTMSGTQKYMAPTEMVPTVDFKTGKILNGGDSHSDSTYSRIAGEPCVSPRKAVIETAAVRTVNAPPHVLELLSILGI